jgi:predicted Fe-Mo cluster-binding NifX family protein
MKIAVASQNRREITGHTGRCRKFWIYEIANDTGIAGKQLLELAKSRSLHESPPHAPHPLDDVQVLISGGMGKGMLRRLAAMGIEALVTRQTDPDASVAAWLDGSLESIPPEAGHHHGDTHGHGRNGHIAGSTCNCQLFTVSPVRD